MPVLLKINALKKYRFFSDFKWDNNKCSPFKKFNLIYGWNGSGKTTLCDFFRVIEREKKCAEDSQAEFYISDDFEERGRPISHRNVNELASCLKIFDQDYIRRALRSIDPINHIFAVGEAQIHLLDYVERLKSRKKKLEDARQIQEQLEKQAGAELDTFNTNLARQVRDALGYNQNSYKRQHAWQAICSLKQSKKLSEDDLQKCKDSLSGSEKELINEITVNTLDGEEIEAIKTFIEESPSHKAIEKITNDTILSEWILLGLNIHKEKTARNVFFVKERCQDNDIMIYKITSMNHISL